MKRAVLIQLQDGEDVSRQYVLPEGREMLVGRSRSSDIFLTHDSVSREHAAVSKRGNAFVLADRESRNGTFVNGIAICRRVLRDGDHLRFGDVPFQFCELESDVEETTCTESQTSAADGDWGDDEPATLATVSGVGDVGDADHDRWRAVNRWRFMRILADRGDQSVETRLRALLLELVGIRSVSRGLLFLPEGALGGELRIEVGGDSLTADLPFAEEDLLSPVWTGVEFQFPDAAVGEAGTPWLSLPVFSGESVIGCICLHGAKGLAAEVRPAVEDAAEALGLFVGVAERVRDGRRKPVPEAADANTGGIVGRHHALRETLRVVHRAARVDSTVLVCGESGTGKELFSRLVVDESRRRAGPFIPVHCSAIEPGLMGTTLFGHEKGAFTNAVGMKRGLFEEADGGTLFLDEIGELNIDMQVKMLRVLQEGEFMRVGGTSTIHVDVRIVAATNRDLKRAIKDGMFREDLYYRLSVITIPVPPLRERSSDIPDLARYFLADLREGIDSPVREITDQAMEALEAYSWPGNVRELRNVIERAMVLTDGAELGVSDLPAEVTSALQSGASGGTVGGGSHSGSLQQAEDEHILSVLEACRNNRALAAKRLGISRSTLYAKLKALEAGQ